MLIDPNIVKSSQNAFIFLKILVSFIFCPYNFYIKRSNKPEELFSRFAKLGSKISKSIKKMKSAARKWIL